MNKSGSFEDAVMLADSQKTILAREQITRMPNDVGYCVITYRCYSTDRRASFEQVDRIPDIKASENGNTKETSSRYYTLPKQEEVILPQVDHCDLDARILPVWEKDEEDDSWYCAGKTWRPTAIIRVFDTNTNKYIHAYEFEDAYQLARFDPNDHESSTVYHSWVQDVYRSFERNYGLNRWSTQEYIALVQYIEQAISSRGLINFIERFSFALAASSVNLRCRLANPEYKDRSADEVREKIQTDDGEVGSLRMKAEDLILRRDQGFVITFEENMMREMLPMMNKDDLER